MAHRTGWGTNVSLGCTSSILSRALRPFAGERRLAPFGEAKKNESIPARSGHLARHRAQRPIALAFIFKPARHHLHKDAPVPIHAAQFGSRRRQSPVESLSFSFGDRVPGAVQAPVQHTLIGDLRRARPSLALVFKKISPPAATTTAKAIAPAKNQTTFRI